MLKSRKWETKANVEESISFDELLTELATKDEVVLASGTTQISTEISHFIGEIPVKKIVVKRLANLLSNGLVCNDPSKYEETILAFDTVSDFDMASLIKPELLRCEHCGGFPKYSYWNMTTFDQEDDFSQTECFCGGKCIQAYIRRAWSDKGTIPPEKIILDYIEPGALVGQKRDLSVFGKPGTCSEILSVGITINEVVKENNYTYSDLLDTKKAFESLEEMVKEYPDCIDTDALNRQVLFREELSKSVITNEEEE